MAIRRGLNWIKYEFGLNSQRLATPTSHHCEALEVLVLYPAHQFSDPWPHVIHPIISSIWELIFSFWNLSFAFAGCMPAMYADFEHCWSWQCCYWLWKTLQVYQLPSKPAECYRQQITIPALSPCDAEHMLTTSKQPPASTIIALELPRSWFPELFDPKLL